jgi:eukaryotic-like serine/threonine-protein kinase
MGAGEARSDRRDAALFDRSTQSFRLLDSTEDEGASPIGLLTLADGEVIGHYRVRRFLGRGGMGDVFEAVDLRSGTPVAIKASRRRLDDLERARFLREGRLAAAISHPHVVYVFAVDECRGMPIIVTELVAGGTLRDLVERHGPLAAIEAVDLTRQVAAGLEEAAREGVVHRDVKPSNCFIDGGGQVKIGDFGLAMSTREAPVRAGGAGIEGTLAFASPEQLRGEPPDVRSDVYSAGATLYFLLTGRPPFDGAAGARLVASALRDPPPSVRRVRPDVPRGLDRVIRRCLAKNQADRPPSHTDLSRLLLPFGSTSSTPATLGLRALAAVVDIVLLRVSTALALLAGLQWTYGGPASPLVLMPALLLTIGYFGACETAWGATPGKWIVGLRVVTTGLQPVDATRAFIRAGLWTLSTLPGGLAWIVLGPQTVSAMASSPGLFGYLAAYGAGLLGVVLLFATARPRNGFAGLHEQLTGTRVVARLPFDSGAVRPHHQPPPIVAATAPRLAHYVVLDEAAPAGVVVGYDDTLARRVWIRHRAPGEAPVSLARRQVNRPSRIHWLAGGRDDGIEWDVYEMAAGGALAGACRQRHPWPVVRGWLFDLADEIVAAGDDGTSVPLTTGRVWVSDARATLLDWDANPDGAPPAPAVAPFLEAVATIGLGPRAQSAEGRPWPDGLPLHAQAFLSELADGRAGSADEIVERLRALSTRQASVRRARRGVHLLACAAAPLISVALVLVALVVLALLARSPDAFLLDACLRRLQQLEAAPGAAALEERTAIEIGMVGRFRPMLVDEPASRPWFRLLIDARRPVVDVSLRRHGHPSAAEIDWARARMAALEADAEQTRARAARGQLLWAPMLSVVLGVTALSALAGLVSSLVVRGGAAFRLFDLAVLGPDGREVTRARGLSRAAVAWIPALASVGLFVSRSTTGVFVADPAGLLSLALLMLFAAGGLFALADPRRGLQDRIAGTSLVPR